MSATLTMTPEMRETRRKYMTPIIMGMIAGLLAEAAFILVQGYILYPGAPFINMLFWGIFCGIGMGTAAGISIILFVVDRFTGVKAILMGTAVAFVPLNLCSYYCYEISLNVGYYGAREMGMLFVYKNMVISVIGGILVCSLYFTKRGTRWLAKVGL